MSLLERTRFRDLFAIPVKNGIYKRREFHGTGTKIVNMGELFANEQIGGQQMRRLVVTPEELAKYQLKNGDLLFARRSFVLAGAGKCSVVSELIEPTVFESSIIRVRLDPKLADSHYYFNLFRSSAGQDLLASIASRTAVSGIRGSDLAELLVPVPELPLQRRIAQLLDAFDKLIQVNERRIALLEEAAQQMYREWFLRFRFPGHEGTHVVGSGIGRAPERWLVIPFGEIAHIMSTSVDPTEIDPSTPYVGLEHIPSRSSILRNYGRASDVKSRKIEFQSGDVLFGKIRPYLHKVGLARVDGVASSDTIVLRPVSGRSSLTLAVASSSEFVDLATRTSNGTKMPRADWKVLREHAIAVPPLGDPTANMFETIFGELMRDANVLADQIQAAEAVRDSLLPRLVGGQLDVAGLDLDDLSLLVA